MDLGLNRRAARLADALRADASLLGISSTGLPGGAQLIDCGVAVAGGLEAGRRLAEVCLAGLATVSFTSVDLEGLWLPAVAVATDHPVTACLASQYARRPGSSGEAVPRTMTCRSILNHLNFRR